MMKYISIFVTVLILWHYSIIPLIVIWSEYTSSKRVEKEDEVTTIGGAGGRKYLPTFIIVGKDVFSSSYTAIALTLVGGAMLISGIILSYRVPGA
jgi:hypothetical protein